MCRWSYIKSCVIYQTKCLYKKRQPNNISASCHPIRFHRRSRESLNLPHRGDRIDHDNIYGSHLSARSWRRAVDRKYRARCAKIAGDHIAFIYTATKWLILLVLQCAPCNVRNVVMCHIWCGAPRASRSRVQWRQTTDTRRNNMCRVVYQVGRGGVWPWVRKRHQDSLSWYSRGGLQLKVMRLRSDRRFIEDQMFATMAWLSMNGGLYCLPFDMAVAYWI